MKIENERIDELHRNGYRIIQDPDRFCFGIDAVLLSHFAQAKEDSKVLDLGTGTGIIPILMEAKTKAKKLHGIEIQKESAEMARRSVALNQLEEKIEIITGDIKECHKLFEPNSYDVVTSNPPYMISQHGIQNPDSVKAIARHEILCTFDDIASQSAKMLKDGGNFFLVHRPFRLVELFTTLTKYKLEPKRMQFVHPYVDKEPNIVLLECKKGGNSRITVEKPLVVYEKDGSYTKDLKEIYGLD